MSAYRFYAVERLHGFSNSSNRFYLTTRTKLLTRPNDQWYLGKRMGLKKKGMTMKNHVSKWWNRKMPVSVRKHLVQKLRDNKQVPLISCIYMDTKKCTKHYNLQFHDFWSQQNTFNIIKLVESYAYVCKTSPVQTCFWNLLMQPVVTCTVSNTPDQQNPSSEKVPIQYPLMPNPVALLFMFYGPLSTSRTWYFTPFQTQAIIFRKNLGDS